MAGKDEYENTWADQWDFDNETEPSKDRKKHDKEEKKMVPKKIGQGLSKTKEGAIKGANKVKDGASVAFSWVKDKCTNKKPESSTNRS